MKAVGAEFERIGARAGRSKGRCAVAMDDVQPERSRAMILRAHVPTKAADSIDSSHGVCIPTLPAPGML